MLIKIKKRYIIFLISLLLNYYLTGNDFLSESPILIQILFSISCILLIPTLFLSGALCLIHIRSIIDFYISISAENELVATLGAAVMRSDGVVSEKEKNIFFSYISNKYNDKKREKKIINILNEKLKNPVKITNICIENKEYVKYNRRFSICRAMFRIAATENGICSQEKQLLEKTMRLLSLSNIDKEHLRAEFGFNHRIEEENYITKIKGNNKELKTLGLNNNATLEEIKKKYKELCFEHHPDKYENSDETTKNYHNERMKEINEAYNILVKQYSNN